MSTLRQLSPELANKSYELFQENDQKIEMVLRRIKEWLSLQHHINARIDDQWLIAFARGCKYSLERIEEKLDGYYTCKRLYSDIFRKNRDPKDPILSYFTRNGPVLPYNNPNDLTDSMYVIARPEYDPLKYMLEDGIKYSTMLADICLYENDNLSISGVIGVFDLEQFTLAHAAQISISLVRKILHILQQGYPFQIKGIHFIHPPIGFTTAFEILKLFASEKLKKRYFVHSTLEDLYKYVPKSNLPKECGGTAQSISELTDYWILKLESYRDWFIEDEQYYADERSKTDKKIDNVCNIM